MWGQGDEDGDREMVRDKVMAWRHRDGQGDIEMDWGQSDGLGGREMDIGTERWTLEKDGGHGDRVVGAGTPAQGIPPLASTGSEGEELMS